MRDVKWEGRRDALPCPTVYEASPPPAMRMGRNPGWACCLSRFEKGGGISEGGLPRHSKMFSFGVGV